MTHRVLRSVASLLAGVLAGVLSVPCCTAAEAPLLDSPFAFRNSGALSATAGLPRTRDARLPGDGVTRTQFLTEVASQFTTEASATDAVRIDVETTTVVFAVEHGLSDALAVSVEVPLVRQDGGVLDGFINDYHDLLDLPDAGRSSAADDRVDVRWTRGAVDRVRLDERRAGLGDARLGLGWQLARSELRATSLRASVELPTGSVSGLAGNDAVDFALMLQHRDAALLADLGLAVQAQVGVLTRIGDDAILGDEAEALVAVGGVALAWPLTERLTLKAQLDAHSDLADTPFEQVGGWSVQGTLGGSLRLGDQLVLDIGLAEDLRPGSAADVAFLFSLNARLP